MILAHLDSIPHACRGPVWDDAFAYIRTLSALSGEGRNDLLGDQLYGQITSYLTKPRSQGRYETHRRYIDIQLLLKGEEDILWMPASELSIDTPYSSEKDIAFHSDSLHGSSIRLVPGVFAVFFPEDAHMPQIACTEPAWVKKLVIKVMV